MSPGLEETRKEATSDDEISAPEQEEDDYLPGKENKHRPGEEDENISGKEIEQLPEEKNENISSEEIEYLPEWYRKPILVLGCGNPLMGDDGFGPMVAASLRERQAIPEDVYVMDVGTSAREILFPMVIGETEVKTSIIIDAVDFKERGRTPGEIFEIPVDDIPLVKTDDFSMHQVPSSNLLRELRDRRRMKVIVLACQIERIPEEVAPGLSKPVQEAVPRMCDFISEYWR